MAAEIRVDTIKGRSGINTFSFKGDGFSFDQKVGIGTTLASDPVKVTNAGKIAVGVVTCHTIFAGIVTGPGAGVGIKTAGGPAFLASSRNMLTGIGSPLKEAAGQTVTTVPVGPEIPS